MTEKQSIQDILPAFFKGELNDEDKRAVEAWKAESKENLKIFNDTQQICEKTELLRRMQKYNAEKALEKVTEKIERKNANRFLRLFQRVASILILPLIIATFYFSKKNSEQNDAKNEWYALKTGYGMRSEFVLPDGTKVFLNSNTTMRYPIVFNEKIREVEINGEAYFEVAENRKQPFIVKTGDVNIEVTGTEFKASNYDHESMTEIVLVEGVVNLFEGRYFGEKKIIKTMVPGEKATYVKNENRLYFEKVEIDKYIAWKNGKLLFRDDTMQEVVRRMNRWFNADIQLLGNDMGDYVYTATFEDESLIQVLDLLKLSAPINYKIKPRKRTKDDTFRKMEIEIIQK